MRGPCSVERLHVSFARIAFGGSERSFRWIWRSAFSTAAGKGRNCAKYLSTGTAHVLYAWTATEGAASAELISRARRRNCIVASSHMRSPAAGPSHVPWHSAAVTMSMEAHWWMASMSQTLSLET